MVQITGETAYLFGNHGWNDIDIQYIKENADHIYQNTQWAMPVVIAPDGALWLYPVARGNVFPLGLWKKIKEYIENNDSVVIPMSKNQDKVAEAAKRYNGYLIDNVLYAFGDKFVGLNLYEGDKKWSHSKPSIEDLKRL